jgi:hypothetical protein
VFEKQKIRRRNLTLYKELADDEMNFIGTLECSSANSIICFRRLKRFEKEEYYLQRSNITCGGTCNLSTVSALQVNVILLKNTY